MILPLRKDTTVADVREQRCIPVPSIVSDISWAGDAVLVRPVELC